MGFSYETLRALITHDEKWKFRVLEIFSDALYMAHLPSSSDSHPVLLCLGTDTTQHAQSLFAIIAWKVQTHATGWGRDPMG